MQQTEKVALSYLTTLFPDVMPSMLQHHLQVSYALSFKPRGLLSCHWYYTSWTHTIGILTPSSGLQPLIWQNHQIGVTIMYL